ncbi:Hypothetical predicted protein [Mytilus galloprovincialis]|uniref:Uncharacterized protein n=1 Tax=Mytilus galloprovincialis TaxID=29158 RepID=A0A8B6FT64_MYTGA|nr:Hypothetical predicted protein [Mytilus galloprovincialis]
MGGTKSIDCNTISRQIWLFCKDNDIWLTCTHIAGKENLADKKSREFDDKLEWKLEKFIEPVHFQNQRGRCKRSSNSSILADTNLVSETNAVVNRQSNRSSKEQEDFESSSRSTICSSFTQENETNCMS